MYIMHTKLHTKNWEKFIKRLIAYQHSSSLLDAWGKTYINLHIHKRLYKKQKAEQERTIKLLVNLLLVWKNTFCPIMQVSVLKPKSRRLANRSRIVEARNRSLKTYLTDIWESKKSCIRCGIWQQRVETEP